MGVHYGKLWNDTDDATQQSTPLSVRRQSRRLLSLTSLDPRSPSSEITRTPIQIESFQQETPVLDCGKDDPRSPTRAFQRTPIPFGQLLPEPNRQKQPERETFTRVTLHQSTNAPSGCTTPQDPSTPLKAEHVARPAPLAQTLKTIAKKNENAFGSMRSPLRATTHPNCLLHSLQQQQIQRQKIMDPNRGKSVASDKENSFVPTT
ncbi:uncharacterized protein LOC135371067 [Ornithodoros turicata]|uniref:uncharacterized protein LOC135371067 n=1 Tax=Ornithodoros turicata TaxID=34597 RepID=UPI003139DF3A